MQFRFTGLIAALFMVASHIAFSKEDYPKCNYKYFKRGKISTSQCYDANDRFGKAIAYNKEGKVIYEKSLRKIGGHSSVIFSYYDDGGVSKAEWSEAPDAGIQWYRSTTWFHKDGTIDHAVEQSYDDYNKVRYQPALTPQKQPPSTPKQETIKCAVIYASEFWYINTTPYTVTVTTERNTNADGQFTTTLKAGDTAKGGQLILAEQFDYPDKYYRFTVSSEKEVARSKLTINRSGIEPYNVKKEVRRYYYTVSKSK